MIIDPASDDEVETLTSVKEEIVDLPSDDETVGEGKEQSRPWWFKTVITEGDEGLFKTMSKQIGAKGLLKMIMDEAKVDEESLAKILINEIRSSRKK